MPCESEQYGHSIGYVPWNIHTLPAASTRSLPTLITLADSVPDSVSDCSKTLTTRSDGFVAIHDGRRFGSSLGVTTLRVSGRVDTGMLGVRAMFDASVGREAAIIVSARWIDDFDFVSTTGIFDMEGLCVSVDDFIAGARPSFNSFSALTFASYRALSFFSSDAVSFDCA